MTIRNIAVAAFALIVPASAAASPITADQSAGGNQGITFAFQSDSHWQDSVVDRYVGFTSAYTLTGGAGNGFSSYDDLPWWWDKSGRNTNRWWWLMNTPPSRPETATHESPQPVPEPSTLLLLGTSAALAATRKARAAQKARRAAASKA